MTTPTPEAIEAAKTAHTAHRYLYPIDGPAHCGGCDWVSRQIGVSSDTQHDWHRTKAALTAAAPFIAAQSKAEALREAADALDLPGSNAHGYYSGHADFGYSEAETHAGDWLRARAATIENKETGNANQPEV